MLPAFTLIRFKVTDQYDGYPDPYIPDGSIVILLQDGDIGIVKLPQNKKLKQRVLQIIREEFPAYLRAPQSTVLTCPKELAAEVSW